MPRLVIVRGPAGAGKSTYVRENYPRAVVFNTDQFFMTDGPDGPVYKFDPTKLGEAHAACLQGVLTCMRSADPLIVVENTFTHEWEWRNYDLAARAVGYVVEMVEIVPRSFNEVRLCTQRSTHAVPAPAVYAMAIEFEHCGWAVVRPIPDAEKADQINWNGSSLACRCMTTDGSHRWPSPEPQV